MSQVVCPMETKQFSQDVSSAHDTHAGANGQDMSAPEALNRIRSILFGEESRKTDQRFRDVVELLESRLTSLEDTVADKLSSLDDKIEIFHGDLRRAVEAESENRGSAVSNLESALTDIDSKTSNRMSAAEARVDEVASSARQQLEETRVQIASGIARELDEMKSLVNEAVSSLANNKADKHALADWFEQLSARLRD